MQGMQVKAGKVWNSSEILFGYLKKLNFCTCKIQSANI